MTGDRKIDLDAWPRKAFDEIEREEWNGKGK